MRVSTGGSFGVVSGCAVAGLSAMEEMQRVLVEHVESGHVVSPGGHVGVIMTVRLAVAARPAVLRTAKVR